MEKKNVLVDQLTDQTINDIKIALKEVKVGKGESIEDVAKEFGAKF